MSDFAVVVIAFNRLASLRRVIGSLLRADYLGDRVDLIVSIDNSGMDTLAEYARSVDWPYGEKRVIARPVRLGLKRHVIECGHLTNEYENICVLEDDLYVSPGFYSYARSVTKFCAKSNEVAGISLYAHQWNPYVDRLFGPIEDVHDVYLLKVASSWGQIWSRERWRDFVRWIDGKSDQDLVSESLPSAVSSWSPKSWLKFHNKYLVDTGKYFVYPRQSLTTNFSDHGEHARVNATYQVPILLGTKREYDLPNKVEELIRYDAFFENESVAASLGLDPNDVDISLYGNRRFTKRYRLTTDILNYRIVRTFALRLRPMELNVLLEIPGQGIYLYDMRTVERNPNSALRSRVNRFLYEVRSSSRNDFIVAGLSLYILSALRRIRI